VLSESVEQGGGELVVDEDAIPFAEGEVAGDRPPIMPLLSYSFFTLS
jgi:hypothetical protein